MIIENVYFRTHCTFGVLMAGVYIAFGALLAMLLHVVVQVQRDPVRRIWRT